MPATNATTIPLCNIYIDWCVVDKHLESIQEFGKFANVPKGEIAETFFSYFTKSSLHKIHLEYSIHLEYTLNTEYRDLEYIYRMYTMGKEKSKFGQGLVIEGVQLRSSLISTFNK